MTPTVYIETSVVRYLTARPSRDLVIAAYQEITREWWRHAAHEFQLVASAVVISEVGAGDPDAAQARLQVLEAITLIDATAEAESLAARLLDVGAISQRSAADAAHVAIAVANGVEYLVTWNFRHIASAAMRARIERVCRQAGFELP